MYINILPTSCNRPNIKRSFKERISTLLFTSMLINTYIDRRTVSKYIDGYSKCDTRKRGSKIDEYYDVIDYLLLFTSMLINTYIPPCKPQGLYQSVIRSVHS